MTVINSTYTLPPQLERLAGLRAQFDNLQLQLATDKKTTTYGGLGGKSGLDLTLKQQRSEIGVYRNTIDVVDLRLRSLDQTSTRLENIRIDSKAAIDPNNFKEFPNGRAESQTSSEILLRDFIAQLNSNVGGRYIFSGDATDQIPVAELDRLLEGDADEAGLKQVVSEFEQANLGADGKGRLETGISGGAVLIAEDAAADDAHPFGLKLRSVQSSLSNVTLTTDIASPAAGDPRAANIEFNGQPEPGEVIRLFVGLPDGTEREIRIGAEGPTQDDPDFTFAIGADADETAANFKAVLDSALAKVGRTDLKAASSVQAAENFFDTAPRLEPPTKAVQTSGLVNPNGFTLDDGPAATRAATREIGFDNTQSGVDFLAGDEISLDFTLAGPTDAGNHTVVIDISDVQAANTSVNGSSADNIADIDIFVAAFNKAASDDGRDIEARISDTDPDKIEFVRKTAGLSETIHLTGADGDVDAGNDINNTFLNAADVGNANSDGPQAGTDEVPDDSFTFTIDLDGAGSPQTVTVDHELVNTTLGKTDGSVSNIDEYRKVLQAAVDEAVGAGAVTVGKDAAGTALTFTSSTTGAASNVEVSAASVNNINATTDFTASDLGLAKAPRAAEQTFDARFQAGPRRIVKGPSGGFTDAVSIQADPSNTINWYQGENGTVPARQTSTGTVDENLRVNYGARANEKAYREVLQSLAAFVAADFSSATPDNQDFYQALADRTKAGLTEGENGISGIRQNHIEFAAAHRVTADAKERHKIADATIDSAVADIENINREEVALKLLRLQTVLQASYQTTKIASDLSLSNFL